MTKDYAKRRRVSSQLKSRRVQSSSRSTSLLAPWGWMGAGLMLGISITAMLTWKYFTISHNEPTLVTHTSKKHKKSSKNASSNQIAKTTRFDFYTLLPNMPAETSLSSSYAETKRPTNVASLPSSTPSPQTPLPANPLSTSNFIIQTGSFRNLAQAEELKVKLALGGFQASIQTVKINDTQTWYRVYLGPFESKEKANHLQQKLEQAQQLHSLVLKMRV